MGIFSKSNADYRSLYLDAEEQLGIERKMYADYRAEYEHLLRGKDEELRRLRCQVDDPRNMVTVDPCPTSPPPPCNNTDPLPLEERLDDLETSLVTTQALMRQLFDHLGMAVVPTPEEKQLFTLKRSEPVPEARNDKKPS